jgi:hypothetical protein
LPFALAHDEPRYAPRAALFSVFKDQVGQLALGKCVDQIGRRYGLGSVHAHVERRFLDETESALGPVELQGRDAQVRKHPANIAGSQSVEHHRQLSEICVNRLKPVVKELQSLARNFNRLSVSIYPDHLRAGRGFEYRFCVPAHPECAINEQAALMGAKPAGDLF